MGLGGVEPPTSPLSGVRSNQLSYRPAHLHERLRSAVALQELCVGARQGAHRARRSSLKEVIQPQVPLRLPCYDFTPVMNHTVVGALPERLSYRLLVQPTPMV